MPSSPDLSSSLEDVTRVTGEFSEALARKTRYPSEIIQLPDIDATLSALAKIVATENELRSKRRERRLAKKETIAEYAEETWRAISEHLSLERHSFRTLEEELAKQIEEQKGRIAAAESDLASLEAELTHLRGSIRTHRPWMDRVNTLLTNVGFTTFRFEEADEIDGTYTLVREDGSTANDTLSEGERTFVSFMYYISSLDSISRSESLNPKLAVIDDPVASLDSDILFVISALIKKLMLRIRDHSAPVKQILILTHNIHFLKEVSYLRSGEGSAPRAFYVLNKTESGTDVSERGDTNPVEVEYVRLWRQIGEWRGTSDSGTGLQNAMRRVIEYYFQTIGRVDERSLVAKFSGDDQIVVRSFFSWINEGSHSLFDGLHFAPTSTSSAKYFEVFEQLFEVSGNSGHYAMMSSSWS